MTKTSKVTVTKQEIIRDLRLLGVGYGDHLAVTLSLKSIGRVEGGADGFIYALLEAVGPEGTVMMNAHTETFPASEIDRNYIFDPATTPPTTGIVPTTLLKLKGALRSTHPVCSVVAVGKHAKLLTSTHTEKSRPYLPFSTLAGLGGKFLSIGLGDRLVSIRHEGQYLAGLPRILLCGVQYKRGTETDLFLFAHPPCESNLPSLVPQLEKFGLVKHGRVGQAEALLAQVSDILTHESSMLRDNPALNQCDDILCIHCREVERRTKLWGRIVNPHFYQRSILLREALHLRNYLIIKRRFSKVSFRGKNSTVHYYIEFFFTFAAKKLCKMLK